MNALTRNTLLAAPIAVLVHAALPKHGTPAWDLLDAFIVAFSFTYLGHLIDAGLGQLPGIETPTGKAIRVAGWFAGGLWCYVLARWVLVAMGRNAGELPSLIWGGVFLVALEVVRHVLRPASANARDVRQS